MNSGYSLIDEITKNLEGAAYDNDKIESSLAAIGESLRLSYIAVKEVVSENHVLCCTYEWSSDGKSELLNSEARFADDVWDQWLNGYENHHRVWTWNIEEGVPCPLKLIRKEKVASLLHAQMYKNECFIGCIDFVDDKPRVWSDNEKVGLMSFRDLLCEYLSRFHKKMNEIPSDIMSSAYDRTTKLPRYEYFCMRVEESFKELERAQLVILSLDFTNFKFINEKYGHEEGDLFLETVAKDIYGFTKYVICCCRSHSDNFLLVCKCDKTYTKAHLINRIDEISRNYVKNLSEKYFDCNLCVNVGVHVIRNNMENIEQAISNANLARKYAKHRKHEYGHSCLTYDPAMAFELKRRAEYISDMKKGIESGEFYLEYQPLVCTENMEVIGAEALVRWKKDNFNRLMPDDFIPIFEKDGCIVKMDYYVYEQVFKFVSERLAAEKNVVPVSVNVSIVHFYENRLVAYIDELQQKYKVKPEFIYFEIDERIAVTNLDNVSAVMKQLQERGFRVYIDNFGSGYSALNTFTKFEPNGIKIGRSLMKTELDRNDQIIIKCVVNMGNKLNLEVIAEGVENEDQRQYLIKCSCEYMQGNLFSRPLQQDVFEKMLDIM